MDNPHRSYSGVWSGGSWSDRSDSMSQTHPSPFAEFTYPSLPYASGDPDVVAQFKFQQMFNSITALQPTTTVSLPFEMPACRKGSHGLDHQDPLWQAAMDVQNSSYSSSDEMSIFDLLGMPPPTHAIPSSTAPCTPMTNPVVKPEQQTHTPPATNLKLDECTPTSHDSSTAFFDWGKELGGLPRSSQDSSQSSGDLQLVPDMTQGSLHGDARSLQNQVPQMVPNSEPLPKLRLSPPQVAISASPASGGGPAESPPGPQSSRRGSGGPAGADIYVPSRSSCLARYREKKARRAYSHTVRYHMRKINADRRPRIKGRFVTSAELAEYQAQQGQQAA